MPVKPLPRCINPNCPNLPRPRTNTRRIIPPTPPPFTRPNSRGRRPDTCSPECRQAVHILSKKGERPCGRPACDNTFRQQHSAERFCSEGCANGCEWCGGPLLPSSAKQKYPDQYCSRECRDKAWEGCPRPICFFCKKPVEPSTLSGRARKDPTKAHPQCYAPYTESLKEKAKATA